MIRTDLGSSASFGPVDLLVNYAEVAPELVTPDVITPETKNDDQERRQEIVGRGALSLTDTWALLASLRYDLQNEQTISDGVGVRFQNDCLTLAVTYEQSNIQDRDIEPEQRVMVSLALKYLGTYQRDRRFQRLRRRSVQHERLEGESPRPSPDRREDSLRQWWRI